MSENKPPEKRPVKTAAELAEIERLRLIDYRRTDAVRRGFQDEPAKGDHAES